MCPWTKLDGHIGVTVLWITVPSDLQVLKKKKKEKKKILPVFVVPLNFTFRFCSFSHVFNRWTLMERGKATHHYRSTLHKTMHMSHALQRQQADGTPVRVKQLELHSLWTKTPRRESRTFIGGNWARHRPHISHSWSEEASRNTYVQKGSLEVKAESCQLMFYPEAFLIKSILAKRHVHTHGRILRCTKYGLWTRQIKMIGQRKPGKHTP